MIKVAIFGAGKFGQYIKEILEKKVEVKCFIDNNKSIQNTKICGYEVVSVENFVENYANIVDNVLIAMAHPRATYQVISQLRTNHINHIYYVSKEVLDFKLDIIGNDGEFNNYVIELDKYNNIIPQLETHIIDSCNLNCKGCTHFSNLFDKNSIVPLDTFINDLKLVNSNAFVLRFFVMGGEPLCNDNVIKYIEEARKLLPKTDIRLLTNGLLIPKMQEDFFVTLKNNNISVTISQYRPTSKIKADIEKILNKYGIHYIMSEEVDGFIKNLMYSKNNNPKYSLEHCYAQGCINIRNGKLYQCPLETFLYKFQEYYKIDYKINTGISLDKVCDIKNILDCLYNTPQEICSYCGEYKHEFFCWEQSLQPKISDWMITEE